MCSKVLNVLDKLINWIDEVPPIEQPQRFGNKAFKTWLNKVKEVSMSYSTL
jgi:serine/threonine-protein phosphatase 2A activator